jgi:hypothetical protein
VGGRTGFLDETWRLALAGEATELRRAAELLLAGEATGFEYDGHRAQAFALAVEGRLDDALAQLNEGWSEEWPFPEAYAADTARVRYLAGDYERSLVALKLAVRGAERVDPTVADLARLVARREPRLRLRAARVVAAGGTPWQRVRNAALALS